MAEKRTKPVAKPATEKAGGESGRPGGGQGRIDVVGTSGVYPGSGPYPSGSVELRTPAEFVHGQTDTEGRPVEGGSGLIYYEGRTLLGGTTPPPSGPPAAKTKGQRKPPTAGRAAGKSTATTSPKSARRTKGGKS